MTDWTDVKAYDVQQLQDDGTLLSSERVEAISSEAAAKQLDQVASGTDRIVVCLDGSPMVEMEVDYWLTRVRKKRR